MTTRLHIDDDEVADAIGAELLTDVEEALVSCCPVVTHATTFDRLFALGIFGPAINGAGKFDVLNVDEVIFRKDGSFVFSRDSSEAGVRKAAIVVPCRNEIGDLVDLAAWHIASNAIATWRGRASLLGAENIFKPRLGAPLVVFETVADWLRADRRGVFVIDARRAAPLLLEAGTLGVMNVEFCRRLQKALAPRIIVKHERKAS